MFTGVSVALCFAHCYCLLVVGRGLLGLSAAMVYPPTLGLMLDLADAHAGDRAARDARRERALAMWTVVGGAGVALGPLFGGWLLEQWAWPVIFAVNVPLGLGALTALALSGKVIRANGATPSRSEPVDGVAAGLSVLTVGAVVYAIIEAPHAGWLSHSSLARYAVAAIAVTVFVSHQRIVVRPLLPWHWFRLARMSFSAIALFLGFGVLFGVVFVVTLYFQLIRKAGPVLAGAMLVPFAVAMAATTPLATPMAAR